MPEPTRTARVTAIPESFTKLSLLLSNLSAGWFKGVILDNRGDTTLTICCLSSTDDTPADALSKTLDAGSAITLDYIGSQLTYVKSSNANGTNILEFLGTPS